MLVYISFKFEQNPSIDIENMEWTWYLNIYTHYIWYATHNLIFVDICAQFKQNLSIDMGWMARQSDGWTDRWTVWFLYTPYTSFVKVNQHNLTFDSPSSPCVPHDDYGSILLQTIFARTFSLLQVRSYDHVVLCNLK